MRSRATLAALIVLLPLLSGCLDLFGRGLEDHRVARTPIETNGWNVDGVFSVHVREVEPVAVEIKATASDGRVLQASGPSNETLPPVELVIPDGTWTIRYFLDGKRWETFDDARFDSTAPTLTGLQTLGDAVSGAYKLGEGVDVPAGVAVEVIDQDTGVTIARALPVPISGLADGIHAFDVVATDEAGNALVEQVMVRSGAASFLPPGKATLGVVARYALEAEVWDISGMDSWITPAQARSAVSDAWLGSGRAIAPDDSQVEQVVDEVVQASMSSGEVAFELYRWMADELDYDKARLEFNDLLDPAQTIDNGGGVCRDLAALYVSLLRAAGVPARLVTGYLGGEINGFHAWVEFYGGNGHGPGPWVPVDVSAIGSSSDPAPYTAQVALQAFGMRHTDMLPLRVITEAQEDDEWSTAVSMRKEWTGQEPSVELVKVFAPETEVKGVLCVDMESLRRGAIAGDSANDCGAAFAAGIPKFVLRATHILDYGAQVGSGGTSVTVTLTLSYPDASAVAPGTVEQITYCSPAAHCGSFTKDTGDGVTVGVWSS